VFGDRSLTVERASASTTEEKAFYSEEDQISTVA
jgi:hypothetical protein